MNAHNRSIPQKHAHIFTGMLLATGAALGFSAKAIFVKLAYAYDVDAVTLLMLRMAFSLPFFIVIAVIEERKATSPVGGRNMALVMSLGLIGYYCSSLLDFVGLQYVSAGLERLILFIYPTMVMILSALFFGRCIHKEAMIALMLSYAGIALAMLHDVQFSGEHVLPGSAMIFAATLTYSIFLVGSGELIPRVGARRFTAYAMIVSCLAVFVQFGTIHNAQHFYQPAAVYGYGLAMAIFSTVIPAFLLAAAIQRIGASHTSVIGALGPVATIGMAAIFLAEPVSAMQMTGAACVIGGILILGMKG